MLNNFEWELCCCWDSFLFGFAKMDDGLGIFFGPFLLIVGCGGEEDD